MSDSVESQIAVELPTLARLGIVKVPDNLNANSICLTWFDEFSAAAGVGDIPRVSSLLLDDALWRDTLVLTWDFRTFIGMQKIKRFLTDILTASTSDTDATLFKLSNFVLDASSVALERPYEDLLWIQALFSFETPVGLGSGVFRIVPTPNGSWKAHVVYTNLEGLKGFPELTGPLRSTSMNHGDEWLAGRKAELEFVDSGPAVVVVGAGHCGLNIGAYLKYLGVPTLIVERHGRIGDSWRLRYETLSLHDSIHVVHMPYLPFPPTWPLWTPAPKVADWLELYANALDLNVWTGANVERIEAEDGSESGPWKVHISRRDGSKRILRPRHVVFATGLFGASHKMPTYPGMDEFQGKIMHSSQFRTAREHEGKKVVILGASTSGHDVAQDHAKQGIDITMIQRGSSYIISTKEGIPRMVRDSYWDGTPPPHISDRIGASYPNLLAKLMHQRKVSEAAELDRELLDGLRRRGFKLNMGEDGSGAIMLYLRRGGGFYFDMGASQMIADGRIKLKNDNLISRFVKNGIMFEDGSFLAADVVICATGYTNAKEFVRTLIDEKIADRLDPVWGLNGEGELNSVFRHCGVPGLYFAMANFGQSRFFSHHTALLIKAQEESVIGRRYTT